MLKTLLRPAMIFVPFVAGVMIPQAHVLNEPPFNLIRWFLILMVFISCLQLNLHDLKLRKEHGIVLVLNLAMGIVPYLLLKWTGQDSLAKAAFFVGIMPTATAAPVVVSFLNGRLGFALTGFTITNLFISLALIPLLPAVTGEFTVAFVGRVVITLAEVILFPFCTAMLLRKIWPGISGLPKKCKMFTFSLWSFILFLLASIASQHFIDHPDESKSQVLLIGLISLVICILNFYLGGKLSSRRFCRESSQILGQKNTTFTMYLALQFTGPLVALGPIFYILWHNTWNAWQMYRYDRRKNKRKTI